MFDIDSYRMAVVAVAERSPTITALMNPRNRVKANNMKRFLLYVVCI